MHAIKKAAAASVLAIAGISGAQASVISPAAPGGSEVLLNIVDNTTNDSISIDLGKTAGQLAIGDMFSLSVEAQSFITNAGGLGGVSYGIQAGDGSNPLSNTFLTSSISDLTGVAVANATKGTWANSILQLVNNLNAGDGTPTGDNLTYGPFDDAIGSPNYIAGGHFNWQTGSASLNTLALGTESTNLYLYNLSGFVGTQNGQAVLADVILEGDKLSIVPIPAAVWLFGSALLGLFGAGRREQVAAAVSSLRDRLSLRAVDLF